MAEAIVQFDYAAQESDELTLKIGDVITDIVISPGGWWEGNLKGTRGMFPDNFVKLVGAEDDNNSTVTHRTNPGRKCKVLFSYDPSNDDELKLQVNDIIDIIGEVEEGWWKGELRDQTGVFPSNFVTELTEDQVQELDAHSQRQPRKLTEFEVAKVAENKVNHTEEVVQLPAARATVSTDSELPTLPPKPVKETCKVLFPYQSSVDDELTIQEGDIIVIISKDGQDKGWWKGELNGKIGVFPDNFVQVLPTVEENSKPVRPPSKASIVTTNRTRDSITKTPLISNTASPPTLPIAQKKTLDTPPKPDEKTSPPGISKKPNLPPPPLKKPQRSPSGSTKQTAPSPTLSDSFIKPESPSTGSVKSPAISPASKPGLSHETTPLYPKLSPGLRKSETSDNTDGAMLSAFSTSSGSYSLNHHHNDSNSYNNDVEKSEMDLDCVGRTAMLTHPTASRVRAPRRRLPSNMSSKDEGPENVRNSVAMMNGNIDNHVDNKGQIPSKSFLEELKLKQFSQGRTRVMIGPGSGGGESAVSPEPPSASSTPLKLPGSGVTFRNNTSPFNQRPQSMFGGEKTSPNTRPFSVIGTASTSSENITLSVKQWNEINDKVSRLETMLESQNFMFTKAIKELTSKLNEETERRLKMQLELEKLTNLVTQV